MIPEKHFAKGSTFPPTTAGKVRLYSMRFCPYAHRARLLLSYYNVPYELVNINLKNKPDWFVERSPLGAVPVLEKDGKTVYESVVCAEFVDDVFGKKQLQTTDAYLKAKQKMLLEHFAKFSMIYYTMVGIKNKEDLKGYPEKLEEPLKPLENALQGKYFGGDVPNLLDLLMWPWFERFPVVKKLCDVEILKKGGPLPKLICWVEVMKELPAVKACMLSGDMHAEFFRQFFDASLPFPDYDMGLK